MQGIAINVSMQGTAINVSMQGIAITVSMQGSQLTGLHCPPIAEGWYALTTGQQVPLVARFDTDRVLATLHWLGRCTPVAADSRSDNMLAMAAWCTVDGCRLPVEHVLHWAALYSTAIF